MKKFAYMLAALSLCAVSFVACDDDKDNNDPDRIHDYECSSDADCKDNANGKTECSGNVCVSPVADKDDCNSNDDCINNANGKVECNSSKKCDFPADPSDEDACDAASYKPQCENGDAWVCKESKRVKEACGEGKECKEGEGCVEKHEEGSCMTNEDCASLGADYICNASYQCEKKAADAKDPCKDVSCNDGFSCLEGICVSEAMKALTDGAAYPSDSPESFCRNGELVYKKSDGNTSVVNCAEKGYSGCVVYVNPSDSNNTRIADCNAQKSSIDACVAANKAKMDVCISPNELYEIFCMQDILGNDIAVPTYDGANDGACGDGQACSMEGESASCK